MAASAMLAESIHDLEACQQRQGTMFKAPHLDPGHLIAFYRKALTARREQWKSKRRDRANSLSTRDKRVANIDAPLA